MSNESDVHGFMAVLEGTQLRIADGTGGGTVADVYHRDEAVQAVEAYIRSAARDVAEAIVDDLEFEDDEEDSDGDG